MGEAAAPVNRTPRVTGQSIVAGDPALRALSEATDRLAATNGVADEIQPNETPDTVR